MKVLTAFLTTSDYNRCTLVQHVTCSTLLSMASESTLVHSGQAAFSWAVPKQKMLYKPTLPRPDVSSLFNSVSRTKATTGAQVAHVKAVGRCKYPVDNLCDTRMMLVTCEDPDPGQLPYTRECSRLWS